MTEPHWQRKVADIGRRIPAPLILIIALILIQGSSGSAKMIITTDNAGGLAFLRLLIGGLLMWIVIRPNVGRLTRTQWFDVLLLGVVLAFMNVVIYQALTRLPLGIVATIGFLGPLAVSIGSARRSLDFIWPALGFTGVLLLAPSGDEAKFSPQALAYGLVYAASWAAYILASARAGRSMRGLDGFVIATLIAAILIAPLGYPHVGHFLGTPSLLTTTLLVSLLITFSFGLEFLALKRIEPRVFGVLLSLEPALASFAGIIMLSEVLSAISWLAISAVTVASLGAALGQARKPRGIGGTHS